MKTVASGVLSALPYPRWSKVSLVLLMPERGETRTYSLVREPHTTYWDNVASGAQTAASEIGVYLDFKLGSLEGESSQEAIIDDAVRRGVRGIAVAPIDAERLEPVIARAIAAGVNVIAMDAPPAPGSRALAYVGTDNVAAGRLGGEAMAKLLPRGGVVAAQVSSLAAQNARDRVEGFTLGAAAANIKVLPAGAGTFDMVVSTERAIADLTAHPEISGAFGVTSTNGPCWVAAARALGRDDLKVVAFDVSTTTISFIRDRVIHAAVAQREWEIGRRSVDILYRMFTNGVTETLACLPRSRNVDTGVDLVTLEQTPWSISITDYAQQEASRRLARGKAKLRALPSNHIEICAIGMMVHEAPIAEHVAPLDPGSLVDHVARARRPVIIDPESPEHRDARDVAAACAEHTRTMVGVPLVARGAVLGVLLVSSTEEEACTIDDLELIERVADVAAVALDSIRLLDQVNEHMREIERAARQREALLQTIADLSSPIVPIAPAVLAMPLIGTMDADRARRLQEDMLREINRSKAKVVLLDVTGLAMSDATVVEHLLQTARAAALLGAEVVLVGITPAAAQLVARGGLDLGAIRTRSNLELGFTYALGKLGGRIVYDGVAR
jgi:ABC-type sugar transport system substrate-binding protein/anti-anti-sigma regulatory factor